MSELIRVTNIQSRDYMTRLLFVLSLCSIFSVSAVQAAPKGRHALKNAEYEVSYDDGTHERVLFKNGSFTRKVHETNYTFKVSDKPILVTDKHIAFLVVGVSKGGTGYWGTIKQVDLNSNPPREIGSYPQLEDRVEVLDMKVSDNKLKVSIKKHGPQDPLCCPTVRDIVEYPMK